VMKKTDKSKNSAAPPVPEGLFEVR